MQLLNFWGRNIADAVEWFHYGEFFVTFISLVVFFIWKIRRRRGMNGKAGHDLPEGHWWKHWENYMLLAALAVFCAKVIVWAPFHQFAESQSQLRAATNELARLAPASGEAPYATLAKELTNERNARTKAEGDAQRYRQQAIAWLEAGSNTSTAIPLLDDAITVVRRERDAMGTTNRAKLAEFLARETELHRLEKRRALEEDKERCAQYSALLRYTISAYRERFEEPITRCGGTLDVVPKIPTLGWWLSRSGIRTNAVATNCGVRFEYAFSADSDLTLAISAQGKKEPANVAFILGTDFHFYSKLKIGDYSTFKKSSPQNTTNCISDVDFILDMFLDSQREEFK